MTSADWGLLIPAVVGVLGAIAAWLRAQAAHAKITTLKAQLSGLKTQSAAAAAGIEQLQQQQDKM